MYMDTKECVYNVKAVFCPIQLRLQALNSLLKILDFLELDLFVFRNNLKLSIDQLLATVILFT